jgi:hypothetical protein
MTAISDIIAARLTSVQSRLALYRAAEEKILGGAQSYSIGDRVLTRADLRTIAARIQQLENEEMNLTLGGNLRVQRVVPRDI